jgi:hypothetical protein
MVTKLWRATAGAEYGLPGRFFSKSFHFWAARARFLRGVANKFRGLPSAGVFRKDAYGYGNDL